MKHIFTIIIVLLFIGCNTEKPTKFSEKALKDTFITLDNKEITFQEVLNTYKGKTIVIDIWASWCGDCIKGMPKVVALQKKNPEIVYLFLSLDKTVEEWKTGIDKYHVNGEHYFMKSGYDGDFSAFIDIDWIPRYMVVDTQGNIEVFKTVEADDAKIMESLKK